MNRLSITPRPKLVFSCKLYATVCRAQQCQEGQKWVVACGYQSSMPPADLRCASRRGKTVLDPVGIYGSLQVSSLTHCSHGAA